MADVEHEVFALLKVQQEYFKLGRDYRRMLQNVYEVDRHRKHIPVMEHTPITNALDKIQSIPFVSFPLKQSICNFSLRSKVRLQGGSGTFTFGTLVTPDMDAIHDALRPSSFEKDGQTVSEANHRNGCEFTADTFEVEKASSWMRSDFRQKIQRIVRSTLLIGKNVKIVLCRLALYENGEHFDWHGDSTHGDNHRGTVLVALNTSWDGGGIHLRHNDIEMDVDLHPVVSKDPQTRTTTSVSLHAVAFYSDVELRVDPVTEGTCLILQYDIYVETEREDNSYERIYTTISEDMVGAHVPEVSNPVAMEELSNAIEKVHDEGTAEVSFPLRHLYRQASIRPENLKGTDAVVYERLSQRFEVSLAPILVKEVIREYHRDMTTVVKYDRQQSEKVPQYERMKPWYIVEPDTASEDEDQPPAKEPKFASDFHLSGCTELVRITEEKYMESEDPNRTVPYLGGAMFIYAKGSALGDAV
ncbi:hypothetical protein EV421DRAFT_1276999 [Armillaria borealis]|uniref:Prolyl 4-hydroxylase alpha subunit domain-containing protein n=1 Tax=Armillaria borealis TaxID=47425 RepID=A0AA39J298_9AGAR|nr:hypothetical protein EV421DRAFT_1276999 [Armillaria borealis]